MRMIEQRDRFLRELALLTEAAGDPSSAYLVRTRLKRSVLTCIRLAAGLSNVSLPELPGPMAVPENASDEVRELIGCCNSILSAAEHLCQPSEALDVRIVHADRISQGSGAQGNKRWAVRVTATGRHRPTNDPEIRAALRRVFADSPGIIVEEMCLPGHRARLDFAIIGEALWGMEIKSDRDSLSRLSHQTQAYGLILDRATLVVGYRLAARAMKVVPSWWGVMLARPSRERVELITLRDNGENASQDPVVLVSLLWAEEMRALLRDLGEKVPSRVSRSEIRGALVAAVPSHSVLRGLVCQTLSARKDWRPAARLT
jgi:hypothetical protein